jgi:hypothetical protein
MLVDDDKSKPAPDEAIARATEMGLINTEVGSIVRDGKIIKGDKPTLYQCLREAQGRLDLFEEAGYMPDDASFAQDSLFCEFGYLVNLDDEVIEFYRGFQERGHGLGRFADGPGYEGSRAHRPAGRDPLRGSCARGPRREPGGHQDTDHPPPRLAHRRGPRRRVSCCGYHDTVGLVP